MITSKKAFHVSQDPIQLIKTERRKRTWMRHSVAVLVLSPRIDQIALALPAKIAARGINHVRVPPQINLTENDSVTSAAAEIAREALSVTVSLRDLQFLGSTRGNAYRGDTRVPYGKWIHWVGLHLNQRNGVFNKSSRRFHMIHWCSSNQLLTMDAYAMSVRKHEMILQALKAFNASGMHGQLTKKAIARLAA